MSAIDKLEIILTTDPKHYAVCAMMMSKTDPWITLKMNYEQCLLLLMEFPKRYIF